MFADFQNPDNIGPNFKWENFPEMVSELASIHVFTTVKETRINNEIQSLSEEFSKEIATTLITRAGYVLE